MFYARSFLRKLTRAVIFLFIISAIVLRAERKFIFRSFSNIIIWKWNNNSNNQEGLRECWEFPCPWSGNIFLSFQVSFYRNKDIERNCWKEAGIITKEKCEKWIYQTLKLHLPVYNEIFHCEFHRDLGEKLHRWRVNCTRQDDDLNNLRALNFSLQQFKESEIASDVICHTISVGKVFHIFINFPLWILNVPGSLQVPCLKKMPNKMQSF